jgi:hypothetical protein
VAWRYDCPVTVVVEFVKNQYSRQRFYGLLAEGQLWLNERTLENGLPSSAHGRTQPSEAH